MLNYDLQQAIPSLDSIAGPGSFAFLDNLAVGLPADVPHKGDTGLTLDEARPALPGSWDSSQGALPSSHERFCVLKTIRADSHCRAPLRLPLPPSSARV